MSRGSGMIRKIRIGSYSNFGYGGRLIFVSLACGPGGAFISVTLALGRIHESPPRLTAQVTPLSTLTMVSLAYAFAGNLSLPLLSLGCGTRGVAHMKPTIHGARSKARITYTDDIDLQIT